MCANIQIAQHRNNDHFSYFRTAIKTNQQRKMNSDFDGLTA